MLPHVLPVPDCFVYEEWLELQDWRKLTRQGALVPLIDDDPKKNAEKEKERKKERNERRTIW